MARDRLPDIRVIESPIRAIDIYGSGTACHEVPLSFIPILIGLLDPLLSPDAWSGTVDERALAIAQVMHFIGVFGTPETLCTDETTTNGETDPPTSGGGFEILESEDCEMGGCSIPYGALRWNNGVLEFKYCGEWYPVEGGTLYDPPVDEDDENPWEETQEYSACGKATVLVDQYMAIGAKIRDNKDDFPWDWVPQVKREYPHIQFTGSWIYNASAIAIQMDALGIDDSTIFSDSFRNTLTCALAASMDDDYSTPENIKNDMHNYIQNIFGWNVTLISFWGAVLEAIGNGDLRNLALAGATYTDAVCDCEDPGITGNLSVWFSGSLVQDTDGVQGAFDQSTTLSYQGRVMYYHTWYMEGVNRSVRNARISLAGDKANVTSMTIRQYPKADSVLAYPLKEWRTAAPPNPEADWHDISLQGPTSLNVTRDEQSGYVDTVYTNIVGGVDHVLMADGRCYSPNPNVSAMCYWEIIEVNGETVLPVGPL